MGVGVKMPRVLAAYPRKRSWRLGEQEHPDAHLAHWEQGADNNDYASNELLTAVEEQLEQSGAQGKLHVWPKVKLEESMGINSLWRRSEHW